MRKSLWKRWTLLFPTWRTAHPGPGSPTAPVWDTKTVQSSQGNLELLLLLLLLPLLFDGNKVLKSCESTLQEHFTG